jgi:hypothetical protein
MFDKSRINTHIGKEQEKKWQKQWCKNSKWFPQARMVGWGGGVCTGDGVVYT